MTGYAKLLQVLNLDQLYSELALQATVDMWKYNQISNEIARRERDEPGLRPEWLGD